MNTDNTPQQYLNEITTAISNNKSIGQVLENLFDECDKYRIKFMKTGDKSFERISNEYLNVFNSIVKLVVKRNPDDWSLMYDNMFCPACKKLLEITFRNYRLPGYSCIYYTESIQHKVLETVPKYECQTNKSSNSHGGVRTIVEDIYIGEMCYYDCGFSALHRHIDKSDQCSH